MSLIVTKQLMSSDVHLINTSEHNTMIIPSLGVRCAKLPVCTFDVHIINSEHDTMMSSYRPLGDGRCETANGGLAPSKSNGTNYGGLFFTSDQAVGQH